MFRSLLLSPRTATLALGSAALALVVSIVALPDEAFRASLQGLQLWWKIVFPALAPFLMLIELMRGLGLLHAAGALLDPLLRLALRLPGAGGLALTLGFSAGMPAGASAVGMLRRDGLVSREEGERLLAASHMMSPVFLIGVAGAGFLHSPAAGLALALLHYAALALLALLQRPRGPMPPPPAAYQDKGLLTRSADAFREVRDRDGRTFGKLLGDAVTTSIQQLFVIGGCMMMFSVLARLLAVSGLLPWLSQAAALAGWTAGDAGAVLGSLLPGVFEPHLGAYAMTQPLPLGETAVSALLSLLLGWGGLSAHAQVKSLTAGTDLRYSRFFGSRLAHGGIASALTLLLWQPLTGWLEGAEAIRPTFLQAAGGSRLSGEPGESLWPLVSPMMLQFGTVLLVLLVVSVLTAFLFYRRRRSP